MNEKSLFKNRGRFKLEIFQSAGLKDSTFWYLFSTQFSCQK